MKRNTANAAPVTVSVSMLGGFSMQVGGNVLTDEINRSQKLWNVLCYLIVHRDRDVSQSELVELLWPGENSSNPINALKTLLYRVRSMLEPMFPQEQSPILSKRGSYSPGTPPLSASWTPTGSTRWWPRPGPPACRMRS